MIREYLEKYSFRPNDNLKANVKKFQDKMQKMKREVWSPGEVASFRKTEIDEIKRSYYRDIQDEKAGLENLFGQFKDVYLKKAESDYQEKAVRYQSYQYKLSAMDDKEVSQEAENMAYSESPIPCGQLDVLVCEMKNRKMKSDVDTLKKTIKEKRLGEPWLQLPESKQYVDLYNSISSLRDDQVLVQYNDQQVAGERIDDVLKELTVN